MATTQTGRRPAKRRFPARVAAAIAASKILGIRAGLGDHRLIGVWAVVVEGRVFVRSWTSKKSGWYRTLREDPRGVIAVDGREIRVRARFPAGERLLDAVSLAYREKYDTPGSRKYVLGLARPRRRATTTELVPA